MLRTTGPFLRTSARSLAKNTRSIAPFATSRAQNSPPTTTWRPKVPTRESTKQLLPLLQRAQLASKTERDAEFEKNIARKKLGVDPEHVTSESSVRPSFDGLGPKPYENVDTTETVKQDLTRLKDSLALSSVPPLSYKLGLAGTIPYLATSLATVYLSWDLNTEWPSQSQFINHILMSHESAEHYLRLLEPIQVGYGAVIISFLGAIHWGLEYAEKHPNAARTKFRYSMGVLAPMLAWPTMALPVQFALTAQFTAFTFMYFFDARATSRGWTPPWYGTYRFVLTFIVGSAILISLIGREKIGADQPRLTGLREKFHKEGHDAQAELKWEKLEEKEREKNKRRREAEEKEKEIEEEKKKIEEDEKNIKEEIANKGEGKEKKESKGKGEKKDKTEGGKGKDESKNKEKDESDEGKSEDGNEKKEDSGEGKEDGKSE